MPFLVAAVVFVGVLCAVDLVLTLAVIRRLRLHTLQLAELPPPGPQLLPVGTRIPDFLATTPDYETVTGADFRPGVIAFFSTTCAACKEQLPRFLQYLETFGHERGQVLAVVTGAAVTGKESPENHGYAEELRGVARVVREELDGSVGKAFSANVFPAFYLVDDEGVIRVSTVSVDGLAAHVPA